MCRAGEADPHKFGIFDMHSLAFVRGDLIRDFMALNKIEILPWDDWGFIKHDDQAAAVEEVELMDRIAQLTLCGNEAFAEVRAVYEHDSHFHPPVGWQS